MGLDTVELVIAFEDEFGIAINDRYAEKMRTPGDVADYVIAKVRTTRKDPCSSQTGFHRIRSILIDEFDIPRESIRPDAMLQNILAGDIRENWARLKNAIGTDSFPKLQRPRLFIVTVVFGIPALISLFLYSSEQTASVALFGFFGLTIIAERLTANRGCEIPRKFNTVQALIPFVGCTNNKVWNREQALGRIIEITAEQLGLKKEDIREDSSFVEDLGAD